MSKEEQNFCWKKQLYSFFKINGKYSARADLIRSVISKVERDVVANLQADIKRLNLLVEDAYFAGRDCGEGKSESTFKEWASLQTHPTWVRVEDRLPESGYDVLVSDGNANTVAYCENKKWDFLGLKHWKQEDVTHWMPLPNKPSI